MNRDNFYVRPVAVLGNKVFTLDSERIGELYNPAIKIYAMISGVYPTKRSKRKRKYTRLVVDVVEEACFKVTPPKVTPHDPITTRATPGKFIGTKGKKIEIDRDIYRETVRRFERKFEKIIIE